MVLYTVMSEAQIAAVTKEILQVMKDISYVFDILPGYVAQMFWSRTVW